jgi:peptide/nickel transport system permease protein
MNAEKGTEAAEKRFREKYGFDKPVYVQFGLFLKRLFTGELIFFQQERPIWSDLWDHMQVTIGLNLVVFVLIYLIAIPIGIYSAASPGSAADRVMTVALFMLYSLPSYWAAELLRGQFGSETSLIKLPILGLHSNGADQLGTWNWFVDMAAHCVVPVICLTYAGLAYISRQMRAGMLGEIRQDYIRTAEAKGAGRARVILIHALRNGTFPIITLFASLLPFLIGGSVIVEIIFNIPGMGLFAYEGVLRREYDVVMATLIMSAVLTLFGILLSDVLYVLVNPQVTFESRK